MASKCETCTYHSSQVKDITTHPTSSSCTWKTCTVHNCGKRVYTDRTNMHNKGRCIEYKDKNKVPTGKKAY